jgi:hypothetical protein
MLDYEGEATIARTKSLQRGEEEKLQAMIPIALKRRFAAHAKLCGREQRELSIEILEAYL